MTNFGRLSIASIKDQVSAGEWQARIDIAGCYRLLAHYGMSDMMANHVTLSVPNRDKLTERRTYANGVNAYALFGEFSGCAYGVILVVFSICKEHHHLLTSWLVVKPAHGGLQCL